MISVNAELLAKLTIGSEKAWQNQSLKPEELIKFFREESDEETIPTYPYKLACMFYNKNFLENKQYVCLNQGDSIHAFWSWLWVSSLEDGLSTRGNWNIPKQDYDSGILYLTPLCISKKYRGEVNWLKYIKHFLPIHKKLLFHRSKIT